jgi:ATP-binding cassette, subfamily C (CFTR/MRP), member 1
MTNKDHEKEYEKERDEGPADPMTAVGRPTNDDDSEEEKEMKEIAVATAEPDDSLDEIESIREQTEEIKKLKSYQSATSVGSVTQNPDVKPKKWYQKLNPLRWGGIPPVPEVRKVCPENEAGFFNKLFFQWQASLMQVSWTP